jgi:hypothetical protein
MTALEKQQTLLLKQGVLAASGAWVAGYQVRQNFKKYWYYKLQVPIPYFQCLTSDKLSKYKHLGKAVTQEHIDAVMSVFRRSLGDEIQRITHTLDDCLLDISSGSEQESEQPLD